MGKTIDKIVWYNVAVIVCCVIEHLINGVIPVVKGLGVFIAIREGFSIMENISYLTNTPLLKYFKKLINDNKDVLDKVNKKDPG
jgi:phage-related holin